MAHRHARCSVATSNRALDFYALRFAAFARQFDHSAPTSRKPKLTRELYYEEKHFRRIVAQPDDVEWQWEQNRDRGLAREALQKLTATNK
jgi:hypothetical protein